MGGGRRYPDGFSLPEDGVVGHLAVDERGRLVVSPLSQAEDDEALVFDGQVIALTNGGTVTISVSGNAITSAVYTAP